MLITRHCFSRVTDIALQIYRRKVLIVILLVLIKIVCLPSFRLVKYINNIPLSWAEQKHTTSDYFFNCDESF